MKTKIIFITLILLSLNIKISAQVDSSNFALESGVATSYEYAGAIIHNLQRSMTDDDNGRVIDLSKIKGSPYENETFILGKATNKILNKPATYFLRYNAYNDVVEMKVNIQDDVARDMLKSLNIYAIINNTEYHFEIYSDDNGNSTDEGYFILKSKGENVNLYLRKIKTFEDEVKAQDGFHKDTPAAFKNSEQYYYKKGRVLLPISTKKNDFLTQFEDQKNEIKTYLKSEKINLKNEKDLIKLINYYDSLI